MDYKLSILICTLPNRVDKLKGLLSKLNFQTNASIEIIWDDRGKEVTTGKKRNDLLNKSKGEYVCFIDDDDDVSDDYIKELLNGISFSPDCVCFNGYMTTNGTGKIDWRLSKDNDNLTVKENGVNVYIRRVNHLCAVKRNIALSVGFPDTSNAEDKYYSDGIQKIIKTEYKIDKQLYHHRYETTNKEY